jgi:hypothetical protein
MSIVVNMTVRLHVVLLLLLDFTLAQQTTTQYVTGCACGFYDADADLVFTDSSIVYFNETDGIPDDLVVESFEHRYDRGWNALYRQGASLDNVEILNDTTARNLTSLGMYCNPADENGLVVGASMRTARQDIFFGSFRASMRAPRSWLHGSALSMVLDHNKTERWDIDVMNTDNSSWAWVSLLYKGQFSDLWLGANFTNLTEAGMNPWYYTEYRVDWTRDRIDYYIGGTLQQSVTKEMNGTLPSTPAPLKWQHWSLGNEYNTQGPPGQRSQANIGWARIFFNSSLTTKDEQKTFDERCTPAAACLMNDTTLRGSSNYSAEALKPWKQYHPKWTVPWLPLTIVIVFSSLFTVLTTKTLWRRLTSEDVHVFLGRTNRQSVTPSVPTRTSSPDTGFETEVSRKAQVFVPTHPPHGSNATSSQDSTLCLPRDTSYASFTSSTPPPTYSGSHTPLPAYQTPSTSQGPTRVNSTDDLTIEPLPPSGSVSSHLYMAGAQKSSPEISTLFEGDVKSKFVKPPDIAMEEKPEAKADAAAATGKPVKPAQPRLDYLAGFIAFSALLVTLNHFGLTFCAAVIIPSVRPHYQSEIWARRTIATYFLDPLWIGPFLMISTRFLVSNYLRTGKLENLAQKIVARPFRLLTPVASIATLEYFLMDAGALNWLEYLASVTWSPWPFTTTVPNPGVFISEIIQLAYLIPNAAPMITHNYCTGVLWTIPVQLQGAWQTLLALIMVKECKTPWKRFVFYAFCVSQHWYGLSWGSYYYAGVLLADLDITYKYKTWLHVRWWVYYPLLWFLICVMFGGFTIDMVTQWTGVQYAEVEYGWHPDTASGLTISQSGKSIYPDYFIPRLNAFLTTVSMQTIVEISPAVQKVLSVKPLQWIFPHIFTIYLIHGFIFWSVGSWAMISIFSYGCPYWLCVLLTAIISYGTLFCSLPLLTPPIELLGKNFTLSLWEHASQEPVPRKPTTFPFGKDLLKRGVDAAGRPAPVEVVDEKQNPFADPDEKAKGRMIEKVGEV